MHQKQPPANVAVSLTAGSRSGAVDDGRSASEEDEERRSPADTKRTNRAPRNQEYLENSFMVRSVKRKIQLCELFRLHGCSKRSQLSFVSEKPQPLHPLRWWIWEDGPRPIGMETFVHDFFRGSPTGDGGITAIHARTPKEGSRLGRPRCENRYTMIVEDPRIARCGAQRRRRFLRSAPQWRHRCTRE